MITVSGIQAHLVGLLESSATLAGISVFPWDGTQYDAQQQALQEKGCCIEVCRVDSETVVDQRSGLAIVEASIPVIFHQNPERNDPAKNANAADLDFEDAKAAIKAAVLGYRPTHGETPYLLSPSGNAGELLADLEGEAAYLYIFTRKAISYADI